MFETVQQNNIKKQLSGPIEVCLDLGGDSLKVAFAYKNALGRTVYGKVDTAGDIADVGIPAVAYYDEDDRTWLYGDEVDAAGKTSFINVVRIKDLLSLLNSGNDSLNATYYRKRDCFPKFYFPVRRDMQTEFDKTVKADRAFHAPGCTPERCCEAYFEQIKKMIDTRLRVVCERMLGVDPATLVYRISMVHSPGAGDEYLAELVRIITKVFGKPPFKNLSSTKALSVYAYTNGLLSGNDEMLVFDMGEESISVAKAVLIRGTVTIEGEEGHNAPENVGGIDLDEALVRHIEKTIAKRETPGTPSYGTEGHLTEGGLQSKQYLLMKDLKQAKVLLSRPLQADSVFKNGVPISVWRELCIQRKVTRDELKSCLGISDCTGVARRIVDYILREMSRPLNKNVKKIFLSGGIAKTLDLRALIEQKLAAKGFNVKFIAIDANFDDDDDLSIYSYEDTAYASAVGGAIVALCNYEVKTTLSLSYGTFIYKNNSPMLLKLFVDRGEFLEDGENEFLTDGKITLDTSAGKMSDTYFSTILTRADAAAMRYSRNSPYDTGGIGYRSGFAVIGDRGSADRKQAEKLIYLKEVASSEIMLKYRGERVFMNAIKLQFCEGIRVDGRGRATPIIKNITEGRVSGIMSFYRSQTASEPYKTEYVSIAARDIELVFKDMDGFKVVAG